MNVKPDLHHMAQNTFLIVAWGLILNKSLTVSIARLWWS